MVPVTTSSLDAGSLLSSPNAPSPPADASSSSGFVAPNFPSGPGYRKYQANCMPVTSTRTAFSSAARNRSDAQIELLIRFIPTKSTAVSTAQTSPSVVFPCQGSGLEEQPLSRYVQTRNPMESCAATNT